MAFQVGSTIEDFSGQIDLNAVATSAAVADGDFSVTGDLDIYNNGDNAKTAEIVFECTFGATPDIHSSILVFAQQLSIDGSNDQVEPNSGFLHDLVASIPVNGATGLQLVSYDIKLRNVKAGQQYKFFVWNRAGVSMPPGWKILITPTAEGRKQ